MTEETQSVIDVRSDEDRNIRAVKTRPNKASVSNEDRNPLFQDAVVSNEGFIINDGFVSGLPRFEDQLGPGESNLDDNDPDPTDPGPSGPLPSLKIDITSPVSNQVIYFPVSQQGGKITARGHVKSESYFQPS